MINVAVIGAGAWGKNLVRSFADTEGAVLYAVCDRDEKRLAAVRALYPKTKLSGDLSEILSDAAVDAVAIATDAQFHYEHARAALAAQKHVYVEKPMCRSTQEAQSLLELAGRSARKFMVGHLLLYHPAVEKLKGLVDSGELGTIYYMYTQRLNLGVVRSNENAWWSLAPHDVSVVNHLYGAVPERVSAQGSCYLQPDIADVVFATLHFADGRIAQVHTSWLDPHKMRTMTIVGSRKMVTFDDMEPTEKIRIYDKGATAGRSVNSYADAITLREGDISIPYVDPTEPLKLECGHFIECITRDVNPRSDASNGLAVVRVLEAGQHSIEAGGKPEEV